MKRKLNKAISILLASIMILGTAPLAALAEIDLPDLPSLKLFDAKANAADESNLTFELINDGTEYEVSYCAYYAKGELVIPSTYNGLPVTSIGESAFASCAGLTSITIPNSVTSIEAYAFSDCAGLTSITIPNSVTSIGEGAFEVCTELTSITISDSVTSIEAYTFYGCTGLTSITIPNSVTSIGEGAFAVCTELTSITISDSVTSIEAYTFYGCTGLSSITISDSVTSIGEGAFSGCTGLISISIPNSVKSIGNSAFYGCTGLTSITIPDSVTDIGEYAFYGCTGLASINVDLSNPNYSSQDGVLFNKEKTQLVQYPAGNETASYEIPSTVTSIGSDAFSGCKGLTSITIPDSVTSIGSGAFYGCTGLISINVDSSNPNYSSQDGVVFNKEKTELVQYPTGNETASYEILSTVTSIGNSAFYGCTGLTSITIPNSVTSIGKYAFWNCSSLKDVYYSGTESEWLAISIGSSNNKLTESIIHTSTGDIVLKFTAINDGKEYMVIGIRTKELKEIVIPSTYGGLPVTSIGDSAFSGCTGLTSITIPSGVTSIGKQTFLGCTGLTSITIPNSVTSIGNSAFSGCAKLASIVIPGSVSSIGSSAFSDCTGLTSITIPNSVTSIGTSAFSGCTGLTSITVDSSNPNYSSQDGVLFDKDKTKLIQYPAKKNATSYEISSTVKSIDEYSFIDCKGLTSITIPNSVTSIGKYKIIEKAFKTAWK